MLRIKGCHIQFILVLCLILLAIQLNTIMVATTPPPEITWHFHKPHEQPLQTQKQLASQELKDLVGIIS